MLEIAEVVDRESLEALWDRADESVSLKISMAVANESCKITLPYALKQIREDLFLALPFFGAAAIVDAMVMARSRPGQLGLGAHIAELISALGELSGSKVDAFPVFSNAVKTVSCWAYGLNTRPSAMLTLSNAEKLQFAASDLWKSIRAELSSALNSGELKFDTLVIAKGNWTQTSKRLFRETLSVWEERDSGEWQFWIKWYDRVLTCKNTYPDLMAPILNKLTKEDWLGDPALVNPLFDEVLAVYDAEDAATIETATPLGETVEYDKQLNLLVLRPLDRIQDDYLATIHSQIASAVRVLNIAGSGANAYQPLSDEIAILNDAQTIHADRPVLILKDVSGVLKRLERKIATGDCPSVTQDANIEDFQSILTDVQGELVGFNDKVRAYFNASRPPVSQEGKAVFIAGAAATLPQSDPALKAAFESAINALENSEEDEDSAREAQYRIVGLLIRARKALKDSAAFVKDASIVGAAATGVGTLAWYAGPAFREFVTAAMKAFGL